MLAMDPHSHCTNHQCLVHTRETNDHPSKLNSADKATDKCYVRMCSSSFHVARNAAGQVGEQHQSINLGREGHGGNRYGWGADWRDDGPGLHFGG